MSNIKNKILFTTGFTLGIAVLGFIYFTFIIGSASANPDYICIKNVSRSCSINYSDCSSWGSDGTRTCHGTKVTKVAYINLRTTCEKGYGNGTDVTTANDQVHYSKADSTHVLGVRRGTDGGAGGRKGRADYTYDSESCSITQTDHQAPIGTTN